MTTNRDWLFSLPLEEQYAWMNAEHQDGTLDGDTAALNARINELTAECDNLVENLDAAYAKNRSLRQHISQMQNGRSEWHVKAVRLEKQLEATEKQCELYRNKFGKCLDYADAIHALMDEGMA